MNEGKPTRRITAMISADVDIKPGDMWTFHYGGKTLAMDVVSVGEPEASFLKDDYVTDAVGVLYKVVRSDGFKTFVINPKTKVGLDALTSNFTLAGRDGIWYL